MAACRFRYWFSFAAALCTASALHTPKTFLILLGQQDLKATLTSVGDQRVDIPPPICSPYDSCFGRCDQDAFQDLPFTCQCDVSCVQYGDCCVDFDYQCAETSLWNPLTQAPTCYQASKDHRSFYVIQDEWQRWWHQTDLRPCLPSIDSCNDTLEFMYKEHYAHLCRTRAGYVQTHHIENNKLYKNIYCALCNGETRQALTCYPGTTDLQTKTGRVRYHTRMVPASFSLLLTFGVDGKQRRYFSSYDRRSKCGNQQMWDPIMEICRKIHCRTEFELVNFQCQRKEGDTSGGGNTEGGLPPFLDGEVSAVRLSLSFEVTYDEVVKILKMEPSERDSSIRMNIASMYGIDENRIQNINVSLTTPWYLQDNESSEESELSEDDKLDLLGELFMFVCTFNLHEPLANSTAHTEPSVDNIVGMMANSIFIDAFSVNITGIVTKVVEIHETVDTLEGWCLESMGCQIEEYWNDEFELFVTWDSPTDFTAVTVRIVSTGKTYSKGDFLASILYQGVSQNPQLIDISGIVRVRNWLNDSCLRLELLPEEFNINNGTVQLVAQNPMAEALNLSDYVITQNGTLHVCFDPYIARKIIDDYMQVSDLEFGKTEAYVSLVLTIVSLLALGAVVVTYLVFPSMRNLPGWNVLNLTFSLLLMQLTFLLGQRRAVEGSACYAVGVVLHYEILVTFCCMNVIAYDLHKTFGDIMQLHHTRRKRKFLPRYIGYSTGVPFAIVLVCCLQDPFNTVVSPEYGHPLSTGCWISNRWAALLFFASPLALTMICNTCLYIWTILSILKVRKKLQSDENFHSVRRSALVYGRMAAVMGFTWIFYFLAFFLPKESTFGEVSVYLFIVFNTLQGVFIFFAFVCTRRVLDLYRESLKTLSRYVPQRFSCFHHETVARSVSTETCASTLSILSIYSKSIR